MLNKSAYQYWVNGDWAPAAENQATPLFLGIASELSVRYDAGTERWQMVYLDSARGAIVLREATTPQGAWTDGVPLVSTSDYPKAYGGFIHPWSTGDELYFTMSAWDSYNVYLMRSPVRSR
ncbi:conserved secreted protein [Mycobacteroides abscessus subsp. abscessus]|nr:conserved secreted protein [Mycobacteroides abscessus subsp. abscessus]